MNIITRGFWRVVILAALVYAQQGHAQVDAARAKEMNFLASTLSKLTRATASYVYNNYPGSSFRPNNYYVLAAAANASEPDYLRTFSNYWIGLKIINRNTVVLLVCDSTGRQALMEDVNCTKDMTDGRYWEQKQPLECRFHYSGPIC